MAGRFLGPEVMAIAAEPRVELEAVVSECLGLGEGVVSRISRLFLAQLTAGVFNRGIDAMAVRDELLHLEDPSRRTRTRPATPFRREPLRGLHHKHYFEARYLLGNMDAFYGFSRGGNEKLMAAIESAFARSETVEEMGRVTAHAFVDIPFETRAAQGKLSGEWIVFAPDPSGNAYMLLAAHDDEDDAIAAAIRAHCEPRLVAAIRGW